MMTDRDDDIPRGGTRDLVAAARQEAAEIAQIVEGASADVSVETSSGRGHTFTAPPPDSFTGYQIVREVHRGGQGVVYQAVQESTNRKVAIKVLREGPFASEADRARFDREVQILGQLNHPSIVAIHDTGVAAGHHFLVMDYISGQPLDVYMASGQRSVDETLQLFATICEAVNAAHLRGIIHRDLKPGNVRIDAEGVPHVLDFGLAKVAAPGLASSEIGAAMTMTGQFVGSLPWAAPEQAEGVPSKIDVRTDVYSLGVILYQMLTRQFPYEVVGNMPDVLDRIMHAEPARPRTLRPEINDEVETIVLKCLQKENDRRYQSAGELARDVRRYLAGEAIEAKRDSATYVLRKQLRKYRIQFAVAAAFVFVLIGSGIMVAWQSTRIAREAQTAREINAFFNNMLATVDPMQLRSLSGFAPGGPVAPSTSSGVSGRDVRVAEMLGMASADIERRFAGKPELEALARETIGMTYQSLCMFTEAEPQLRTALKLRRDLLGESDPDALRSKLQLAYLLWNAAKGHTGEAEALARSAYEGSSDRYGVEDATTLAAARVWALILADHSRIADANRLFRETLAVQERVLGEDHPDTLATMADWALALFWQNRLKRVEELIDLALERSEALGPEHHLTIRAEALKGLLEWLWGYHELAEQRLSRCLGTAERILGKEHPTTLLVMMHLATTLYGPETLRDAETLYREALDRYRTARLEDQRDGLFTLCWYLPANLFAQGRIDEAVGLTEQAFNIWARSRGSSQGQNAELIMRAYRGALLWAERVEELRRLTEELIAEGEALLDKPNPEPHLLYDYALERLHSPFAKLREPTEALAAARRLSEIYEHESPWVLELVASAYRANGMLDEAIEAQRQTIDSLPQQAPFDTVYHTRYRLALVDLLTEAGEVEEADRIVHSMVEQTRENFDVQQAELVARLIELARVGSSVGFSPVYADDIWQAQRGVRPYENGVMPQGALRVALRFMATQPPAQLVEEGRYSDAERVLRAYLKVQELTLPPGSWRFAETTSWLGAALTGQGRFDEAEPLLLDAYHRMKENPETPQERIADAVERIVALYDASDRPDEADKWRAKLNALEMEMNDNSNPGTDGMMEDSS